MLCGVDEHSTTNRKFLVEIRGVPSAAYFLLRQTTSGFELERNQVYNQKLQHRCRCPKEVMGSMLLGFGISVVDVGMVVLGSFPSASRTLNGGFDYHHP